MMLINRSTDGWVDHLGDLQVVLDPDTLGILKFAMPFGVDPLLGAPG